MSYLIVNEYQNKNFKNYELKSIDGEILNVRDTIKAHYTIGDFVTTFVQNGKVNIKEKVVQPENFLEYYQKSEYNIEYLKDQISSFIDQIDNINLKLITEEIVLSNEDYFMFPAAKTIHHAYIGGLAEHTISMLKFAQNLTTIYNFDSSLVYAAIILHDYAKVYELEKYGLTYSVKGNLLGHISMISNEVYHYAKLYKIDNTEEVTNLLHILLAHHGKLEYGSPKEPMTLEAYIVSMIDEFDAKVNYLTNQLEKIEPGRFTSSLNGFDRRRFYKKGENNE